MRRSGQADAHKFELAQASTGIRNLKPSVILSMYSRRPFSLMSGTECIAIGSCPLPRGEGGPRPALSSAGAGRVRGHLHGEEGSDWPTSPSNPSPGSLRSPPSPQGRGWRFSLLPPVPAEDMGKDQDPEEVAIVAEVRHGCRVFCDGSVGSRFCSGGCLQRSSLPG